MVFFLNLFTKFPMETIGDLKTLTEADINKTKIILADEASALLHDTECLDDINQIIDTMFKSKKNTLAKNTNSLPQIFVSPS
mmetsp:Transcript_29353/g.33777  ORF Transcript_29353/g.33777 Transcript_29353/m.33777 type:complete len:82 (+) Transcript_29353:60-305(+)